VKEWAPRLSPLGVTVTAVGTEVKPVSPKTVEWTELALIFGMILEIGVALCWSTSWPLPALTDRTRRLIADAA
jgi:hypothetical protein